VIHLRDLQCTRIRFILIKERGVKVELIFCLISKHRVFIRSHRIIDGCVLFIISQVFNHI